MIHNSQINKVINKVTLHSIYEYHHSFLRTRNQSIQQVYKSPCNFVRANIQQITNVIHLFHIKQSVSCIRKLIQMKEGFKVK